MPELLAVATTTAGELQAMVDLNTVAPHLPLIRKGNVKKIIASERRRELLSLLGEF